jgi:hypothetical protein
MMIHHGAARMIGFGAAAVWHAASRRIAVGALASLALGGVPSAAEMHGVAMPETGQLRGTPLLLNGIGLRTYSWLRLQVYVAGLYLERRSHDAAAIMGSAEKKLLVIHFLRDIDADRARASWREGFADNCRPPCHLEPADVERFLAGIPAFRAGDVSTFAFSPDRLEITVNGTVMGTINDPLFARVILGNFIGNVPSTEDMKRELLGSNP